MNSSQDLHQWEDAQASQIRAAGLTTKGSRTSQENFQDCPVPVLGQFTKDAKIAIESCVMYHVQKLRSNFEQNLRGINAVLTVVKSRFVHAKADVTFVDYNDNPGNLWDMVDTINVLQKDFVGISFGRTKSCSLNISLVRDDHSYWFAEVLLHLPVKSAAGAESED